MLTSGASTLLRWSVTGSDSISLSRTVGSTTTPESARSTSKRVYPRTTTTYTLTATNSVGTVTAVVTVYVLRVRSFTATPASIAVGDSSELEWDIDGEPTEVSIDEDVGDVTGLTSVSVSPESTTTYKLTATKIDGGRRRTVTSRVRVTINTPPVIESFTASKTLLVAVSDESTLLSWDITGSSPISVSLSKTVGSTTTPLLSSLPVNSSHSQSLQLQ